MQMATMNADLVLEGSIILVSELHQLSTLAKCSNNLQDLTTTSQRARKASSCCDRKSKKNCLFVFFFPGTFSRASECLFIYIALVINTCTVDKIHNVFVLS